MLNWRASAPVMRSRWTEGGFVIQQVARQQQHRRPKAAPRHKARQPSQNLVGCLGRKRITRALAKSRSQSWTKAASQQPELQGDRHRESVPPRSNRKPTEEEFGSHYGARDLGHVRKLCGQDDGHKVGNELVQFLRHRKSAQHRSSSPRAARSPRAAGSRAPASSVIQRLGSSPPPPTRSHLAYCGSSRRWL